MGISSASALPIIRESVRKPFTGRVFVVGRQWMLFDAAEALSLARLGGVDVSRIDPASLEVDEDTRKNRPGNWIRDDAFFRILGVPKLESIDVSDYEGASVIHDLNTPIPDHMEGIADVIVDGSTLDNVFDPACCIRNLSRMLKPGGRLISFVLGSNHLCPYVILTPLWLHDYFVMNRFKSARVTAVLYREDGCFNALAVDQIPEAPNWMPNPPNGYMTGLVLIAEKAAQSTWNVNPIQHQYRGSENEEHYRKLLAEMETGLPDAMTSNGPQFCDPPAGYRFVPDPWYKAEEPPKVTSFPRLILERLRRRA